MRYWLALKFFAERLTLGQARPVSLDELSVALHCTRRNAQLVVKKLVEQQIIDWQSGVGRGHFPSVTLKTDVSKMLEERAYLWLEDNKVAQALELVAEHRKAQLLSDYIGRYRVESSNQDILQVPFYRGTHDLDPIAISRRTEQHIADCLYAYLLRVDNPCGMIRGDLAQHWLHDGDTLTMVLRKGLHFHDGSPILAQDVHAHFLRLLASDCANAELYRWIDSFVAQGDDTLRVRSKTLANILPKLMSQGPMGIAKLGAKGLTGSGPFALLEQTKWCTRLGAYPQYHGYRPWLDGVEIWNVGDKAKNFELNSDVYNQHYQHSQQATQYQQQEQWEVGAEYVLLNANRPWLAHFQHRLALLRAIRTLGLPQSIIDDEVAGASSMTSAPGPLPRANFALASEALSGLVWPDEPLTILTYRLKQHVDLAAYLAQMLTKLGIVCRYRVEEFPDFERAQVQQHADIIVSGEVLSADLELSLLSWLVSSRALQTCLTADARDALIAQVWLALAAPEHSARVEQLQACEQSLQELGLYAPLFHVKQQLHLSKRLSAAQLLANGWIDFCEVVIKRTTSCDNR